jgi:hypothetical protein
MKLPVSWIERIFDRLTVRYGTAFRAMYADLDQGSVVDDWATVLGGFMSRPTSLAYGLDNLPEDKPPTAMQFRAICNRSPVGDTIKLTDAHAPMPEPVRKAIEAVKEFDDWIELKKKISPAEYTIRRIEHIAATRGFMTTAQKQMIESCQKVTGGGVQAASEDGMADRRRTDELKQSTSEAVEAFAKAQGIDLDAPQPSARNDRFWAAGAPMSGSWGPGFGPKGQEA